MASSAMGRCWACCSTDRKPGDTLQLDASGKLHYRVALRSPVRGRSPGAGAQRPGREALRRWMTIGAVSKAKATSSSPTAAGCCCAPGTTAPIRSSSTCIRTRPPTRSGSTGWVARRRARADAAYFAAWLDRVIEAADARDDYNDAEEKRARSTTCEMRAPSINAWPKETDPMRKLPARDDACWLLRRRRRRDTSFRRRRHSAPGRSHRADAVAGWQRAGLHRQHREPRRRQERSPTCGASATTAVAACASPIHPKHERIASAVVARWQVDRVPVRPQARRGRRPSDSQVWLMPASGGKARRLTNFARWRRRFRLVPRRQAPGADRPRSRTPRRHAEAEESAADRHRALPVQGRRHRLSRPAPQAPVRRSTSPAARPSLLTPGAHDEQLPAWSPDGKPDRLRDQARRRSRPSPQLRHLRDRAEGGRAGAPADDVHRLRPRSVLGNAAGLEPGQLAHRLPAQRRGQVDLLRAVATGRGRRCHRHRTHPGADRPLLHQAALGAGRPAACTRWSSTAASPTCRGSISPTAR